MSYYYDYNSTTPLAPEALQAMLPFLTQSFGNASSPHSLGQAAANAVKDARKKVAALLGAQESEIVFTSGGTESNNAAIRSALASQGKKEIVISAVEHSSVRKLCVQLTKEGYLVREVGVDSKGRLDIEELETVLSTQTALVSIMMANNETGIFFPIEEIGALLKKKGILFHVDAVQCVGKHSVNLSNASIDFLSLSAHKFYGPKGVGALYVKKGSPFSSFICGGSQERGRRAGTENVPGIVGLGEAADLALKNQLDEELRLKGLRDFFESELKQKLSGCRITGEDQPRLTNTSHICFEEVEAEVLLAALDQRELFASSGSACMSGAAEPSAVLTAMGFSDKQARSAVRFSFGKETTQASVSVLTSALSELVGRLRSEKNSAVNFKGVYR